MVTLKENEIIHKKVRKHWFVLVGEFAVLSLGYALPFVAYAYYKSKVASLASGEAGGLSAFAMAPIDGSVIVFIIALWTLVVWMRTVMVFMDYYLDVLVITNKRMIDIEQKGFFHREMSTFPITRVQDVTVRIRGIIATLLDFGEVHVQTAGASHEFVVCGIPHPREIKELILDEHATSVRRVRAE